MDLKFPRSEYWREWFRPKLSRRLVRLILSLYLGIAVVLTMVQLSSEYKHEKNNLISQISSLAQTFGVGKKL